MDLHFPLRIITFYMAALAVWGYAREPILPVRGPMSHISLGGTVELLDDVYSADVEMGAEFAPCNCFSAYGDFSYRLVSYEFDTMLHDQRHEALDLRVNGFNESYLGVKFMPYSSWGIDVSWRLPPGEGSQVNRFHRISVNPFYVFPFTSDLNLGAGIGYAVFLEDKNYQPGDELELKGSMVWHLAWDITRKSGWKLDYVFLYRFRIQESRNLNMEKSYQKMDDLYQGFRLRLDAGRYFSVAKHSLGVSLFYEMNRGDLFGQETGHSLGLYTRFVY